MAFDGGMLCAVLHELNARCAGYKVERVVQPAAEEVDLLLAMHGQKHRLAICAGSSAPRMALTYISKENPATAPMFCMLLRKHLAGARLREAVQCGFDRVARLYFDGYDEMGYPAEKSLVVEIMGKCSNLMLLDAQDKILSVLRPVDMTTSRRRLALPGMPYALPPAQEKADPLRETSALFLARMAQKPPDRGAARALCDGYQGVALQTASEIVFRATGREDALCGELDPSALWRTFDAYFAAVRNGEFTPVLVTREDGAPLDYTYAPTTYRGAAAICTVLPDFATLLDRFFGERDRIEHIRQRAADLLHILGQSERRIQRKLAVQQEELAATEEADHYRRTADMIVSNLYRLSRGMTAFRAVDYESEGQEEVTVTMDGRLSPSANAQHYYKLYNKAKTARRVLAQQIAEAEADAAYLRGVRAFLERAETEADLSELREELYRAGYASRMKNYAPRRTVALRPRVFYTSGGYRLLCGRNNLQNEQLTFHTAARDDLWFHVKGAPGSHVLLLCGGEEPDAKDYTEAAEIAAYYSSLSDGAQVPVDYTRVKNIKKPPAARPGYVTYKTNYTAYVTPRLSLPEETAGKGGEKR